MNEYMRAALPEDTERPSRPDRTSTAQAAATRPPTAPAHRAQPAATSAAAPARTTSATSLAPAAASANDEVATSASTAATGSEPAPTAAIEIRGLAKRYGAQTAVDGLDLRIEVGQVVALLGPNGAGKSTTAEAILGLVAPDAGEVTVLGHAPAHAARNGNIGAMLQNGAFIDDTSVKRMLGLVSGICAHPRPLSEVIDRAEIEGLLKKNVSKLSGGEAQKVRFALALLPDPDVILLDEPTVGMDVESRRRFWAHIRTVAASGRTVLFTTHLLDEADQEADRIIVMDHGRITADGTGAMIRSSINSRTVSLSISDSAQAASSGTDTGDALPALSTADPAALLGALPGVDTVTAATATRFALVCADSDSVLRALFDPNGSCAHLDVHDVEVTAPRLEDAFLELTRDPAALPRK